MESGGVLDFQVLRLQHELDRYIKTQSLPHILLDGAYTLEDLERVYHKLSKKHQKIADRIIHEYHTLISSNLTELIASLKKEYTYVMSELETTRTEFTYSCLEDKYRKNINPVRALYYEYREAISAYSPENPRHDWILSMLADNNYRNMLLDCLLKDIQRLEEIIRIYYLPISRNTIEIPLELIHAKRLVSDFRHFYQVFMNYVDVE
jgi:hypothetical protein